MSEPRVVANVGCFASAATWSQSALATAVNMSGLEKTSMQSCPGQFPNGCYYEIKYVRGADPEEREELESAGCAPTRRELPADRYARRGEALAASQRAIPR